jgi:CHAT domain-containing protein
MSPPPLADSVVASPTLSVFESTLKRADAAIAAMEKGRSEAHAALNDALPLLDSAITKNLSLRAMVPVQAAFMCCLVGDLPLAQQFAAKGIAEAAQELEELCADYKQALDQNRREIGGCRRAANYVVAFVPFVAKHDWVAWEELDLIRGNLQANVAAVSQMRKMRPQLDTVGWASWPYPPETEKAVKYWSARALTDWGRILLDNVRSGKDIESAQLLAQTSLDLLSQAPRDQLAADTYNLLGRSFLRGRDPSLIKEKGIPCLQKSIEILENIGNLDDAALDRGNVGAAEIELARLAEANDDPKQALLLYEQAEKHLRSAVDIHRTCGFPLHLPRVLMQLGALYISRKNWDRAEQTYLEIWKLLQDNSQQASPTGVTACVCLAQAYLEQNKVAQALDAVLPGIRTIETPGAARVDPETAITGYQVLGEILRQQNETATAEKVLSVALQHFDDYNRFTLAAFSGETSLKRFRSLFEALIDCCATLSRSSQEQAARAFNLAERIKWHLLTLLLRFLPLKWPGIESEPLIAEEGRLLKTMADLALNREARAAGDTAGLTRRIEAIWTELEPRYPEYVAIRRQKTAEFQEVVAWLDPQVPVLVEYYLGETTGIALAFVLKKDAPTPTIVRLPTTPADLVKQVLKLRPNPNESDFPSSRTFNEISRGLHSCLIQPLLQHLPEGAGVCIVPYGVLHNLPFCALFDGKRYLIERNPLVIAPTATGLRWWRTHGTPRHAQSCLIAAVSTRSGVGQDLNEFRRLAHDEIARLFSNSVFISSEEATKVRVRDELQRSDATWDVVHVACHGDFEKQGWQSYLEMQPGPGIDDPNWKAIEIGTQIRTSASLVTLSACDSGIVEASSNDEVAGLAHAFLFAGASSVLATLWRVQQGVGVEVTRDFYKWWMGRFEGGQTCSKIEALQKALRACLCEKSLFGLRRKRANPYLWGTFQLYGDWR